MFRFNFDKKYVYIFLIAMVIFSLINMSRGSLLGIILTLPAVIIAITFHEYAHAYMADKFGDDTPRMQGRLNINPISHIDPFGFVLLMFAGFGWGKPVEINTRNFNKNVNVDKAEAIVSLAGPIMNFILAIISALILAVIYKFSNASFFLTTIGNIVYILLQEIILINIGLGVFNLLPLPPLDGSKIFINFFPYNARRWIMEHNQTFYIIFLILWITGLAGVIISPIIKLIYQGLMNGIMAIFGLF